MGEDSLLPEFASLKQEADPPTSDLTSEYLHSYSFWWYARSCHPRSSPLIYKEGTGKEEKVISFQNSSVTEQDVGHMLRAAMLRFLNFQRCSFGKCNTTVLFGAETFDCIIYSDDIVLIGGK